MVNIFCSLRKVTSLLLLFLEVKRGKHEREVAIISSVSCNIDAKAGRVLTVHIFFLFPVSSYFSSFFLGSVR